LGLGILRGRFRSWIGSRGRSGGFDNTPPSDDVVPPLAQVHLLGRGPGLLSFRITGVTNGVVFIR
jgi:hypothetical protein